MPINKWSLRKLVKNWNEGATFQFKSYLEKCPAIIGQSLNHCFTVVSNWPWDRLHLERKSVLLQGVSPEIGNFTETTWRDDVINGIFRRWDSVILWINDLISLFDRKAEPVLMERMHVNPNLDYIYTRYTSETVKQLNLLTKKLEKRVEPPVSQNDVILFSLGSWSHSYRTLRVYKKNLNSLFEILKSIKQNPKFLNLRLVF